MGVPWITEYYIISFESHLNSSLRENIKKLYFKISLLWASYQPPGMDKLVRVLVYWFVSVPDIFGVASSPICAPASWAA